MYLGVNGVRLCTPRSGVARYVENVLRSWAAQPHPFDEVRVYTPRPAGPEVSGLARTRNVVLRAPGPLWLWEQAHLPRAHGGRAVLVCPSYVAPLAARCPILLVHHGSYEGYEGYAREFGWWTRARSYRAYRWSARRADVVVTVSEHSRREIVRFYGIPESKVHVIPEGVDTALFRPLDDPARLAAFRRSVFGEDAPFLLFVGKPAPRRNVVPLLKAYARIRRERRHPHRLLFIGSDLRGVPVARIVEELGLSASVVLLGHASHETIVTAYNAADLLVYPSSYEGFGMPVLEAMACGTPAIALRNTAFLEFADGAAYLAERGDEGTLLSAIDRVLGDAALREALRRAGPERARAYDWKGIAAQTMTLAVGLAERRPS